MESSCRVIPQQDGFHCPTIPQALSFANHTAQCLAMGFLVNELYSQYNDPEIPLNESLSVKFYITAAAPCIFYGASLLNRVRGLWKRQKPGNMLARPLALSASALTGSFYYWINASMTTCNNCSGPHLTDAELDEQCKVFTLINLTVAMPIGICLIACEHKNKAEPSTLSQKF